MTARTDTTAPRHLAPRLNHFLAAKRLDHKVLKPGYLLALVLVLVHNTPIHLISHFYFPLLSALLGLFCSILLNEQEKRAF